MEKRPAFLNTDTTDVSQTNCEINHTETVIREIRIHPHGAKCMAVLLAPAGFGWLLLASAGFGWLRLASAGFGWLSWSIPFDSARPSLAPCKWGHVRADRRLL
jgi:hypothetical protein